MVGLNVDVIVVWGPAATVAVKNAATTIPVVFLAGGAAVEHGLVSGLARPGGNLTGITFQANRTLAPKYFEYLRELLPKLSHVAVLRFPAEDPVLRRDLCSLGAAPGLLFFSGFDLAITSYPPILKDVNY